MTKRWTAYKLNIADIVNGEYSEGFVKHEGLQVNRARLLGVVVSKFIGPEDKYAFVVIDDGTETIRVRSFEDAVPLIKSVEVGDSVDVIGRIRKYEDEVYIVPEIIKKVDPNWEVLRKIELLKQETSGTQVVKEVSSPGKVALVAEEEIIEEFIEAPSRPGLTDTPRKQVIRAINDMDKGEGVEISYLMDKIGLDRDTVISILNDLMNEGTIFEPRAGKVKLLG
jgi:RPA family protein